jgi:hypothetical protein
VGPHLFVISIAMIVVGIVACYRMPAYWRGGEYYERVLRLFLTYGETQGRAFASAVPISSFGSALFGANALALFGREITTGQMQIGLEIIATALLPATMVTLILLFAVTLFGRPRALIPPQLRNHRGVIGELIAMAVRWVRARSRRAKPGQ